MSQFPLPDVESASSPCFLTLNDGRVLAYTEWGDRTGYPVFYFHGTPSSRLEGALGAAHEALICYREWDFDLEMVKVPTHIWLGDQDIFVSHKMGEYLRSRIPNVDFHWAQGKGHLNVEIWDDILAACATHVRSAGR